jgi:hypothetical protein
MSVSTERQQVIWLLHDLALQLGYSMAARTPEQFERLVRQGPSAFADAVLVAEGLDPDLQRDQRKAVRAFVRARFDRWAAT